MTTVKHMTPRDAAPVIAMAREAFAKNGSIQPMAFVGMPDNGVGMPDNGVVILPMDFSTPRLKDMFASLLKDVIQEVGASWVVFVSESWVLKLDENQAKDAMNIYNSWMEKHGTLATHPLRMEVIVVNYENAHGGKMGMIHIQRDGDKATLGDIEWTDAEPGEGRFSGFFTREEEHA